MMAPMPLLDDHLRAALVCDLTTTGRVTGGQRTVEVWFAAVGDRAYILAGGRERAHWVQNLQADPQVTLRLTHRTFAGHAVVVEGSADDPIARAAIAAKYGTTGLKGWLRDALAVAIDLDREMA
jgi:deazaflavin-dependent oxidoreductase (nitroreductase family)